MNGPGRFLSGARRTGLAWVAFALGVLVFAPVLPARTLSREYDVKAAFLYNFAMFIDWPKEAFARPDSPLVIGVLGTDPFGVSLTETVAGEQVKGRAIVIKHLSDASEAPGCQIVFISTSEKRRLKELLRPLRGKPVVTVADMPGFVEAGGLIGFETDTRVSIKVNASALRAANILVSSKLLRLAQIVEPEAPLP